MAQSPSAREKSRMPGPEERLIEQPRPREPDTFREPRRMDDGLRDRLERLPRGHPSSPFRDDGTRKPPPPDYRQAELPLPDEPLTDDQYAKHVQEITKRLAEARASGLATNEQHTVDKNNQVWSKERRVIHKSIMDEIYNRAENVPNERQAVVAGGLPGAGKTTILDSYAGVDCSRYLKIDPDKIKETLAQRGLVPELEGLSPMEAADLVHEESSYIAKLIAQRAQSEGKNIIWDITMSSQKSVAERIDDLRRTGYGNIEGIFIDIPPEVSQSRAQTRHREGLERFREGHGYGGRFVPANLMSEKVDADWGSVNRKTFEQVKHFFDAWAVYDNSVNDRPPLLVTSSAVEERKP